jgi:membrane protein involved in colicin uptake
MTQDAEDIRDRFGVPCRFAGDTVERVDGKAKATRHKKEGERGFYWTVKHKGVAQPVGPFQVRRGAVLEMTRPEREAQAAAKEQAKAERAAKRAAAAAAKAAAPAAPPVKKAAKKAAKKATKKATKKAAGAAPPAAPVPAPTPPGV